MNNDKRFDYIDSAKAFGMMAVMWGHIHFNDISTCLSLKKVDS